MKPLSAVSRKEVIEFYPGGEAFKKNKPIPSTFASLNLDDPNGTDQWLRENGFKSGVISGFTQWALLELSVDDIGSIAVVNHIFKGGRVLKNLKGTRELLIIWLFQQNPICCG
ncbi:MAG: hypothetical protein ACLGRW_10180 [Acidobacteriota bacterium]